MGVHTVFAFCSPVDWNLYPPRLGDLFHRPHLLDCGPGADTRSKKRNGGLSRNSLFQRDPPRAVILGNIVGAHWDVGVGVGGGVVGVERQMDG